MPTISKRVNENKPKFTFGVKEPTPQNEPRIIDRQNTLKQTGVVKDVVSDFKRNALLPGKRMSKTGNIYWETRINRSDALGKRV